MHEHAHAKKAYKFGCRNILIITPYRMDKDKKDERFTYYQLPSNEYRKIFGNSKGVCCYDADNLTYDERLAIVKAGMDSDKKLNNDFKTTIIFSLIVLLAVEIWMKVKPDNVSNVMLSSVISMTMYIIPVIFINLFNSNTRSGTVLSVPDVF